MDSRTPRLFVVACAMIVGTASVGCNRLSVNMYADELADLPPVTTASVEGVRQSDASPTDRQRPHQLATIAPLSGAVEHGPLYFEDTPFEISNRDDRFAWTTADFLFGYYGLGRSAANVLLFPVSAAASPPWQVMTSDGRPSRTAWCQEVDDERSADQ